MLSEKCQHSLSKWWSAALKPPDPLTAWEWAERNLILSARSTAFPGQYRTDQTPYVRAVLEALQDPAIRQIILCWGAQSSKTMTMLVGICYFIDQDPGPALMVQSSQDAATSFVRNRFMPMIEDCPVLARHLTGNRHDFSAGEQRLDNMSIFNQGAQSPAQLASRPIKYLLADEIDKWQEATKKEADSLSLALERVKSFRNHKVVMASTPTLATGPIWQALQTADMKRYNVPCPRCGAFFVLKWDMLKWPKEADLETVKRETWVECPHCGGEIREPDKAVMLEAGEWVPTNPDAPEDKVSFHLSELYSPWSTWGSLAIKFIDATREAKQGSTGKLHNFINSSLAEPWEERTEAAKKPEEILALETERQAGVVPDDALALTAGIDTQDNGFWLTLWAWSPDLTGHLVREAFVPDLEIMAGILWGSVYRTISGAQHPVSMALIDSQGHRTGEVYDWCRRNPGAIPIKGEQRLAGAPWKVSVLDKIPGKDGKQYPIPGGLQLYRLDTTHFKNMLAGKLALEVGTPGSLNLYQGVSNDFVSHMTSEYQDEKGIWRQPSHKRCDLWDCSGYALAGVEIMGVRFWQPAPAQQDDQPAPRPRPNPKQSNKWW